MTSLDRFVYRNPWLRKPINQVLPRGSLEPRLLHRTLTVSLSEELGLIRLAWLLSTSPTEHELASLLSIAGLLRPGQTFVDVGANVGLYSVITASIADVIGAKVIAIEPMPATVERLRENLSPFSCASVLEVAASDHGDEAWMKPGNLSGRARISHRGTARVLSVDSIYCPSSNMTGCSSRLMSRATSVNHSADCQHSRESMA